MKKLILVLVLLLAGAAGALRWQYGGGEYYADLSKPPLLDGAALETVAVLAEPPGNLTVSADGRLFFNTHPESRPQRPVLFELVNGAPLPYPDFEFQQRFTAVLGLFVDTRARLWVLDTGFHGLGEVTLFAFELASGRLVHEHVFPSHVAQRGSFFNDLQVTADGRYVFIADVSFLRKNPALVVYDTETGIARRALEGHPSVLPQDWIVRTPLRDMTFFGGLVALKPGIDGLVLSADDAWLYYGAMVHDGLFRVRARDLIDESLTPDALATRVERVSDKPLSDGLSVDFDGNVYVTDVEHQGIARVTAGGRLETLIRDERVRWADGMSFGPGGWLYFTDSAIPDMMMRTRGHIEESAPYYIFRFRPGVEGLPGR